MDDHLQEASSGLRREVERILHGSRRSDNGRLTVPASEGMILLPHDDIVRLSADGAYTRVHLLDGRKTLVCKGLGDLHSDLPLQRFFRCHHSHVINLVCVLKIFRIGGYRVELCTGEAVEVARRRWKGLMAAVERMSSWE